jgi:POT family proton-dependent oligopeptide transporter
VERVYNLYYWMINLGSTAATLTIPKIFDLHGPRLAFAIPGVAMSLALLIFLAGRRGYVRFPPTRSRPARSAPGPGLAASLRAAGGIALVFAPVLVFWALYFQYDSAWTLQADKMDRMVAGLQISAGQMTTLNAILILLLIPLFTLGVYPAVDRLGVRTTPLRKMSVGMFVAGLSFVAAAWVEGQLQAGGHPHVAWQLPQYALMGVGEVLVSVTALEFAYTQAPARLKSLVMGLWYLTISTGSLMAAVVAGLNRWHGVGYYHFYAWLMLGAAVGFLLIAIAWRATHRSATA